MELEKIFCFNIQKRPCLYICLLRLLEYIFRCIGVLALRLLVVCCKNRGILLPQLPATIHYERSLCHVNSYNYCETFNLPRNLMVLISQFYAKMFMYVISLLLILFTHHLVWSEFKLLLFSKEMACLSVTNIYCMLAHWITATNCNFCLYTFNF